MSDDKQDLGDKAKKVFEDAKETAKEAQYHFLDCRGHFIVDLV